MALDPVKSELILEGEESALDPQKDKKNQRKKKAKKRRRKLKAQAAVLEEKHRQQNRLKSIRRFAHALGIDVARARRGDDCSVTDDRPEAPHPRVDTIASQLVPKPPVQVVVFHDAARKRTDETRDKGPKERIGSVDGVTERPFIGLKSARFDVFRLGITGFDKQGKNDAKVKMAIRLGAKPPKNECSNYKIFMEKEKERKLQQREQALKDRLFGLKVKRIAAPRKKKVDPNDVQGIIKHVGRYKDGSHVISRKIIQKIRSTK